MYVCVFAHMHTGVCVCVCVHVKRNNTESESSTAVSMELLHKTYLKLGLYIKYTWTQLNNVETYKHT